MPLEKHRKISLERVNKFKEVLAERFYEDTVQVTMTHWAAPDRVPFSRMQEARSEFQPIAVGQELGPLWSTHWIHFQCNIPEQWKEQGEIHLVFDCGGESLLWTEDGRAYQALNGQKGEDRRERIRLYPSPLFEQFKEGFYLECACNELFGNSSWKVGPTAPDKSKKYSVLSAQVSLVLPDFWKLYHDFILIADIAKVSSQYLLHQEHENH